MKLIKSILMLTLVSNIFSTQAMACVPTENLRILNRNVNVSTIFYVTSRKKSLRMGLATFEGQTYFNLFVCDELREFSLAEANEWNPDMCIPTSPTWLPFVDPQNTDQEVLSVFSEYVKHYLTEAMGELETKELLDPAIVLALQGLDMALNGAIGYGLQYYAYRFAPASRMGRLSRNAARGAGWFLIISVLFGGALDVARQMDSETIYHQKVEALSQVINDIDQGRYFSEDSPSTQVLNIIEIIEESIMKASQTLYYSYCIDGDLA